MKKYGARLFDGINRHGQGVGSFSWVVDQAITLIEEKDAKSCPPQEQVNLAVWWMQAALQEAGSLYADDTKPDTDFSVPLHDVFLIETPQGCIAALETRISSITSWHAWAEHMPFTFQALQGPSDTISTITTASAATTVHNPVVSPVMAVPNRNTPAPAPAPAQNNRAGNRATASAVVPGRGKGKGKGKSQNNKGKGKGKGQQSTAQVGVFTVGESASKVSRTDVNGTVQSNASLNTHTSLGSKRVCTKDLQAEFPGLCVPSLMSHLHGDIRYTVCTQASHPDHKLPSSKAHVFPANYRKRVQQYFC